MAEITVGTHIHRYRKVHKQPIRRCHCGHEVGMDHVPRCLCDVAGLKIWCHEYARTCLVDVKHDFE